MEIFKELFSSLNQEAVKYMVAGGIAVNPYGIERATADIDIVLKLDKENLLKFVKVAKKLELKPKVPKIKFEDIVIPVIPINTLIEMKEKSGRPQDKADTYYLKKIMEDWKDEK